MAATYPSGIRAFPTYANGDLVTPATINDPDLEITAIETGLRDGLAHHLVPDLTANQRSLGTTGQQWYDLVLSHDLTVAGSVIIEGGISLSDTGILGDLFVNGDTTIHGGLTVDLGANFGASAIIAGQLAIGENLFVSGNIVNAGATTIHGGLAVDQEATIHGGLTVDLGANFGASAAIIGGLTIGQGLTVSGPAILDSTVHVKTDLLCDRQVGVTASGVTTLYTATQVHGADVGGLLLVCGTKVGVVAQQFTDVLFVMTDGTFTLVATHDKGATLPRTYSWSGLDFQLNVGANTINVCAFPILVGSPGA